MKEFMSAVSRMKELFAPNSDHLWKQANLKREESLKRKTACDFNARAEKIDTLLRQRERSANFCCPRDSWDCTGPLMNRDIFEKVSQHISDFKTLTQLRRTHPQFRAWLLVQDGGIGKTYGDMVRKESDRLAKTLAGTAAEIQFEACGGNIDFGAVEHYCQKSWLKKLTATIELQERISTTKDKGV